MKKFLVLLVVAAFFGTALAAVAADKGPAEVKLEAKMGTVTFPHAEHQGFISDCKTCHHTGGYEACDSCHGDAADGAKPKYKDAIHNNCKGCHKEMKKGPTKCGGCHVK